MFIFTNIDSKSTIDIIKIWFIIILNKVNAYTDVKKKVKLR